MFHIIFSNLLQQKNITPYKIAKDTGISQGLMNNYKNGVKSPTFDNLLKIANYLNVSVDFLLGRTDNPEINKPLTDIGSSSSDSQCQRPNSPPSGDNMPE